jgi:hypothetical protein
MKKKNLEEMNEDIQEVWDKHLPNIADLKREQIDTSKMREIDGTSLRIKLGKYYTREEYEKYRKEALSKHKKFQKKHDKFHKKLIKKERRKKND